MPLVVLVRFVRAAVGHQQHVRAGVGQVLADRFQPDILANRYAQFDASNLDGFGQRAMSEDPLLIESAVVRQLMLQRPANELAAFGQDHGVEIHAVVGMDRAEQQRRTAVGGGVDQPLGRFHRLADEFRLRTRSSGG